MLLLVLPRWCNRRTNMTHITRLLQLAIFAIAVTLLFGTADAYAQTCCVMRETEFTQVSNPSNGEIIRRTETSVEESCRAETAAAPCDTIPNLTIDDSCQTGIFAGVYGEFCNNQTSVETQVQCSSRLDLSGCQQAIINTTSDCASDNANRSACDARNECFYHAGTCKSVFDVSTCRTLPNNLCTQSRVCEWTGDRCISQLEANLSREYEVSEGYSRFIPACAYAGTCRNVEDLIGVVIAITREVLRYIGILAFIFFLIGGATMIASFGNPERFKKGRQILVAASVGLVISLSAFVLVTFILNAVGVSNEFRIL